MPELPEVETVRRGLATLIVGDVIHRVELRREDLRGPFPPHFAERLAGRAVAAIDRRAKFLLFRLDDDNVVIAHLGMSGSFRVIGGKRTAGLGTRYRGATKSPRHDHVVFHMRSGREVVYNDPRRFGLMDLVPAAELETSSHLRHLGPDPVGADFDATALAERLAGRRAPLKSALIDQKVVAGIGNIYACEALWRARLSPFRVAGSLVTPAGRPGVRARRLADAIRGTLEEAIAAGGSSLRDHINAEGEIGDFQTRFAVYDRQDQPCPRSGCRGIVKRVVQSGRSTFYCARCQR